MLDTILKSQIPGFDDPTLVVGNSSKDDAAVVDIGNGQGIVSTTDFFMPIVDDPFTFGRIAATNAISDIYAMGGKPIVAIAILGWPINTLAQMCIRDRPTGQRAGQQGDPWQAVLPKRATMMLRIDLGLSLIHI